MYEKDVIMDVKGCVALVWPKEGGGGEGEHRAETSGLDEENLQ